MYLKTGTYCHLFRHILSNFKFTYFQKDNSTKPETTQKQETQLLKTLINHGFSESH